MRTLVTGGYGFIGSHLVRELREQDVEVLIADRLNRVQDISDSDLDSCSIIFHLAATPRLGISLEKPGEVIENNLTSTLRLLEYCRKNPDILLVNVSSSSVKFADLEENPYALSKAMGEQLVDLYRTTFKAKATNVRLFNVYGPGEADYDKHTTLLKACKKSLLTNKPLIVNGDGKIWRDYTHVADVVSGLLVVAHEMMQGDFKRLYELGAGKPTATWRIVEEFGCQVEYGPKRHGDAPATCAEKGLQPANWTPQIDVLDYIQEWKAQGCPND
jgi:UDP-glucose 4-epimerase